jgi:hypothetical protein
VVNDSDSKAQQTISLLIVKSPLIESVISSLQYP